MIIKVFQTNKNGKIEFTKEELEDLLSKVYQDGYNDGCKYYSNWYYTTTPAYVKSPINYRDNITCSDNNILLTKDNTNEI